ncbi:MAG: hypothetical protein B7Y43_13105 [Sphingomonas sp. 28-62-20]|nr:MAG: hypothetical protein B7Y43_13105 [Sphingomonas sp. 28-62-20]
MEWWLAESPVEHALRTLGSALTGDYAGYWRWRIGDYRVVARVEDARIAVLVVRLANLREVYQ